MCEIKSLYDEIKSKWMKSSMKRRQFWRVMWRHCYARSSARWPKSEGEGTRRSGEVGRGVSSRTVDGPAMGVSVGQARFWGHALKSPLCRRVRQSGMQPS